MKISVLVVALLVLFTGCASSTTNTNTQRLDALESSLEQVRSTASQALDVARDAASDAASAQAGNAEVERKAQQALTLAEQASERALRIADECCGKK